MTIRASSELDWTCVLRKVELCVISDQGIVGHARCPWELDPK